MNTKAVRNPYKRVFEHVTFGGMPMASIAVHEDDFEYLKPDNDILSWDKVRVEICVGGSCIGTTLKRIVDTFSRYGNSSTLKVEDYEKCPIHNIILGIRNKNKGKGVEPYCHKCNKNPLTESCKCHCHSNPSHIDPTKFISCTCIVVSCEHCRQTKERL